MNLGPGGVLRLGRWALCQTRDASELQRAKEEGSFTSNLSKLSQLQPSDIAPESTVEHCGPDFESIVTSTYGVSLCRVQVFQT